MKVTVGTLNLKNLFSRFDFAGAIEEIQTGGPTIGLTIRYEFTNPSNYKIRMFCLIWSKPRTVNSTVAKILFMVRCNIKLHANFQPNLPMRKESIVGVFFDDIVKNCKSPMNKRLMEVEDFDILK